MHHFVRPDTPTHLRRIDRNLHDPFGEDDMRQSTLRSAAFYSPASCLAIPTSQDLRLREVSGFVHDRVTPFTAMPSRMDWARSPNTISAARSTSSPLRSESNDIH